MNWSEIVNHMHSLHIEDVQRQKQINNLKKATFKADLAI